MKEMLKVQEKEMKAQLKSYDMLGAQQRTNEKYLLKELHQHAPLEVVTRADDFLQGRQGGLQKAVEEEEEPTIFKLRKVFIDMHSPHTLAPSVYFSLLCSSHRLLYYSLGAFVEHPERQQFSSQGEQ